MSLSTLILVGSSSPHAYNKWRAVVRTASNKPILPNTQTARLQQTSTHCSHNKPKSYTRVLLVAAPAPRQQTAQECSSVSGMTRQGRLCLDDTPTPTQTTVVNTTTPQHNLTQLSHNTHSPDKHTTQPHHNQPKLTRYSGLTLSSTGATCCVASSSPSTLTTPLSTASLSLSLVRW